jgi:hypothetical protein
VQNRIIEKSNGVECSPMKVIGDTDKRGTEVHFLPDTEIFKENNDFHYEILAKRLRELSFLNNGVRIRLLDERTGKEDDFSGAGGVKGFVDFINKGKTGAAPERLHAIGDKRATRDQHRRRSGDAVEQRLQRAGPLLHQQHPAARRRHPPDRPARRDDARHQQVHRRQRAGQEGQGRSHRRRHARRPVPAC